MPRSAPQKVLSVAILALVAGLHGAVFALQIGVPALIWICFALAQGLALPVWGAFCDRFGSKRVMLYSIALSVLVALLGYAQLFNYRISQAFCFAVLGGMVFAGLPTALAYALSQRRQRENRPALGAVVGGFFGGFFLMAWIRFSAFVLLYPKALSFTATALLVVSLVVFACVALLLPDVGANTADFLGMNALQRLWHGFADSSRAGFAASWKWLLSLSMLAAGAVMNGVPALVYAANPAAGTDASMRCLFAGVCVAAVFSFLCSLVLRIRPEAERWMLVVALASLLLSSILALLAGSLPPAAVFAPVVLNGAALGSVLTLGLVRFAGVARKRSAGAEMGAVAAIGLVSLIGGNLFALAGLELGPSVPFWFAALASVICLSLALTAVRSGEQS